MKRGLRVVLSQRLNYSNGQAILGQFEIKNCFTSRSALFLFPLKDFFHVAVLDNRYPLIEIEKPLNNLWDGIHVNVPVRIPSQRRKVKRSLLLANIRAAAIVRMRL